MLAMVLSVLALVLVPSSDVSNPIIGAEPAIGSVVTDAPSSVTVALKQAVDGPVIIVVRGPNGKVVSAPQSSMLATNVATDLDYGLKPGLYSVTYRFEGKRGPEGGVFQFAYRSGSPRGLSTWSGNKEVPKDVRLPSDAQSTTPGVKPTDPTPTALATDDAAAAPDPAKTDAAADADSGGSRGWLLSGLGVVLLAIAGGTAIALRRRKKMG